MKCELFPFQKIAVKNLRCKAAEAIGDYSRTHTPQVVSLQAPTGSGKTIIMTSFIEAIFCGTEDYIPQSNAIVVWLSDSPSLNEQSLQKIISKSDKIKLGQCVVIKEDSFDKSELEDGYIYFLNTQKISRTANLCKHSDGRQYTIWETLQNTLEEKSDRLYIIIDEAHRGALGNEAGRATSIMQKFIMGSPEYNLSPMPLVIGMSATAERFNRLVGNTASTLRREIISAADVRSSGLLKDRILILHPEDALKYNDMAVLDKATDEWIDKCKHWKQYCTEQHYAQVNPVFVVQVANANTNNEISNTDLIEVIARIEKRVGRTFDLGEVVHTFGDVGDIELAGLKILHVNAEDITDNKKIKVVMFKENLSTGWDCPRAETMMSFRKAEGKTYIAQLLGRMVRTPLQSHILVDDFLNDVRLYLPYFNSENVQSVVDELQSSEVGDIPTDIGTETLEHPTYAHWSVRTHRKYIENQNSNYHEPDLFDKPDEIIVDDENPKEVKPQEAIPAITYTVKREIDETIKKKNDANVQSEFTFSNEINREEITKYINDFAMLTYKVRSVKIDGYLKSLLAIAELLTSNNIYNGAQHEVEKEFADLIHSSIDELKKSGEYSKLKKDILQMKLAVHIFDMFGNQVEKFNTSNLFSEADDVLDPQLRIADSKLGYYGIAEKYALYYYDINDPNSYKIDCIIFATVAQCIDKLNEYAKKKYCKLKDEYRTRMVSASERCKKKYDDIVSDADLISKHNFTLPEDLTAKIEKDGIEYRNHLLCDDNGIAKIKLNSWEKEIIEEEGNRKDFVCWLRNIPRASWALCLPYEVRGEWKEFYPDFIIVRKDTNLGYALDILEPHDTSRNDSLPKAKALVDYAKENPKMSRIQLIKKKNNKFVRLDMSKTEIQGKIKKAMIPEELENIFDSDGFAE